MVLWRHSETLEDIFADHKNTVMGKHFEAQRHHHTDDDAECRSFLTLPLVF